MKCLIGLIALLAFAAPAFTQDTRPDELSSANNRLNAMYQGLLGRMTADNQDKLKRAQRAWITYRDLDCKWAYPAAPLDCLISRTEERITALGDTVFLDKAGNHSLVGKEN